MTADRLAALLHEDKYLGPAIHEDAYAAQFPTWPATECSACWSHAARLAAAGVTIATQPAEYAEEAVYAALLYINQRTPRPRAAEAFMDALRQDGYEVRPIAQPAPDALRAAAQAVVEHFADDDGHDVVYRAGEFVCTDDCRAHALLAALRAALEPQP